MRNPISSFWMERDCLLHLGHLLFPVSFEQFADYLIPMQPSRLLGAEAGSEGGSAVWDWDHSPKCIGLIASPLGHSFLRHIKMLRVLAKQVSYRARRYV